MGGRRNSTNGNEPTAASREKVTSIFGKARGYFSREARKNVSKLCEIRLQGQTPVLGRLINHSEHGFCVESPSRLGQGPVIVSGTEIGIFVGNIKWCLGRRAGGVMVNRSTSALLRPAPKLDQARAGPAAATIAIPVKGHLDES